MQPPLQFTKQGLWSKLSDHHTSPPRQDQAQGRLLKLVFTGFQPAVNQKPPDPPWHCTALKARQQGCKEFKRNYFSHSRIHDWKATNGTTGFQMFFSPIGRPITHAKKIKVSCTVTAQQPRMTKNKNKQRGVTPNTT